MSSPTRCTARARLGAHIWPIGLATLLLLAAMAGSARAGAINPQSPYDLGNEICAAYRPYCADLWRQGMAGGETFNHVLSEVCIHVGIWESEDAGIACLELGIHEVPSLVDGALVFGQFLPGERQSNPYWRDHSDHSWALMAIAYFERIPEFCDQATPEIQNYLPCLAREVRFFPLALKGIDIKPAGRWQ